jgi:solute carrier family 25 phosphate transporter 23/24/25/41
MKVMVRFWQKEGFKGFFKGNGANVVRVFPFTAFQFYFYELFKLLFFPKGEKNVYKVKLYCGGCAGICTSTLTYPLDLVRTLLAIQTSEYKSDILGEKPGMFTGLYRILRKKGILGWYKGWFVSMIGVVPYIALQMSAFDYTASYFMPSKKSKWFDLANLAIGAWAGFVGAGLSYPLDVMRRKMQLNDLDPKQPQYKGIIDCMVKMHKADGFKSFFRGFTASQVKIIPAAALMFMINERMKRWFGI